LIDQERNSDMEKTMRERLAGTGFVVFSTLGAALVVGWLFALLDRNPAPSAEVSAGWMRQLRRYSACLAGGLCAWAAGVALLALAAGA
jgi:hypothetical protein